jgi:hypothetical protein
VTRARCSSRPASGLPAKGWASTSSEHLPATFVYAEIDVDRFGLFAGVRGKQIAGRCVLTTTGPFHYQAEWQGLVAAPETRCVCTGIPRAS